MCRESVASPDDLQNKDLVVDWLNRPSFDFGKLTLSHPGEPFQLGEYRTRREREDLENQMLTDGATRSYGAGHRAIREEPDPGRTCFERDRDRILHSQAFRRLEGKTQVFTFPLDGQRTRLTHTLEVAQIARGLASALGLNATLCEAQALGHDCGHTPGGHAGEAAFSLYLESGFDHAVWGADVTLLPLNLCVETLDGIRNHSWSRPRPATPEGAVVRMADRIAYTCHDLADAISLNLVRVEDIPENVIRYLGTRQSKQIHSAVNGIARVAKRHSLLGMPRTIADAISELRQFNYEHVYAAPEQVERHDKLVRMLRGLLDYYLEHLDALPQHDSRGLDPVHEAINYLAGLTDGQACQEAAALLGWSERDLPLSVAGVFPSPLTSTIVFGWASEPEADDGDELVYATDLL